MVVPLGWMLLAGLPLAVPQSPAAAPADAAPRVRVRIDRDAPYRRGESARVFLRLDEPAHVAVFRVDTDGRLRVLFPRDPWDDTYMAGRGEIRLAEERDARSFAVDDAPGVGYVFAVAAPEPFDFRELTRGDYWDDPDPDGARVRGDPYVWLSDLAARIAPAGDYDYDVAPYYVDRRFEYPRFVCYGCHAQAPTEEWDPYGAPCTRYRIVVRGDPRDYPTRDGGRNVVIQGRLRPGPGFLFRDAEPPAAWDRTADDAGGPGAVPPPEPAAAVAPGRARPSVEGPRRAERTRHERRASDDSPAPGADSATSPPRSTGEPELRRRRP